MPFVIPLISLLFVLTLSIVIVRIGSVALVLTGISREMAKFQARSAFTGAGFTTSESEQIVNHPVRRRVIMWLMLLGNLGIATTMATIVFSLMNVQGTESGPNWVHLMILAACPLGLMLLTLSSALDRYMSRVIEAALKKFTKIDVSDYVALFRLAGDYSVSEINIQEEDWLAGMTLIDARLSYEGVLVLGIERASGAFDGAPRGDTRIMAGDTLIVYGRQQSLSDLDTRRRGLDGYTAHIRAVKEQTKILDTAAEEEPPTPDIEKD